MGWRDEKRPCQACKGLQLMLATIASLLFVLPVPSLHLLILHRVNIPFSTPLFDTSPSRLFQSGRSSSPYIYSSRRIYLTLAITTLSPGANSHSNYSHRIHGDNSHSFTPSAYTFARRPHEASSFLRYPSICSDESWGFSYCPQRRHSPRLIFATASLLPRAVD